jgi:hypothetical protein
MTLRRFWLAAGVVTVMIAVLGVAARNAANVKKARQAAAAVVDQRRAYFEMLRPVALSNCELERFGEPNDGGYLMCATGFPAMTGGAAMSHENSA